MKRGTRLHDVLLCADEQPGWWTPSRHAYDTGSTIKQSSAAGYVMREHGYLEPWSPSEPGWTLTATGRVMLGALEAT